MHVELVRVKSLSWQLGMVPAHRYVYWPLYSKPFRYFKNKRFSTKVNKGEKLSEVFFIKNKLKFFLEKSIFLDENLLRELISTTSLTAAPEVCSEESSVIFRTPGNFYKAESRERLRITCDYFNFSCFNSTYPSIHSKAANFPDNVLLPIYPKDENALNGRFDLDRNFSEIYPKDPTCAIVAFPYMIFNFWSNVVGDIDENKQILRDIIQMTSRSWDHIIDS